MVTKFYIIATSFEPNTAPTNRLLSFVHEFDKLGVQTTLVFLYPNSQQSKLDGSFHNINIEYWWDKLVLRNKRYSILIRLLIGFNLSKRIEKGARVFLFGAAELVYPLTKIRDVYVYHERTEHPDVIKLRFRWQQKRYLSACKHLSGLFVISTALKKYFMEIGVSENLIDIVNMTVDITRFSDLKKQENTEKYIAYCGTASNNKDGVNNLIQAFAFVHSQYPDLKLYIIGKIPQRKEEKENLKLIEELGLKNNVILTGVISAEKMPQVLKNAQALVLARPESLQAQNGFPTKLGEYLLTENPVIVTRVGDIPLFLEDSVSAFLAEPGNVKDISDKINMALSNKELSLKVGQEGVKVAKRFFNSHTEVLKIINRIFN